VLLIKQLKIMLRTEVCIRRLDRHNRIKPKFHLACHVTSRRDTPRSTCRARRDERVVPCCSTSSTQPNAWARHVEGVVSRRGVTWRTKLNLGFSEWTLSESCADHPRKTVIRWKDHEVDRRPGRVDLPPMRCAQIWQKCVNCVRNKCYTILLIGLI